MLLNIPSDEIEATVSMRGSEVKHIPFDEGLDWLNDKLSPPKKQYTATEVLAKKYAAKCHPAEALREQRIRAMQANVEARINKMIEEELTKCLGQDNTVS